MGGMIAQLVLLLLKADGLDSGVGLVTFGSPGVGSLVDAEMLASVGDTLPPARPPDRSIRTPNDLRVNIVGRGDLVVRGAQRVLSSGLLGRGGGAAGRTTAHVGGVIVVDLPAGSGGIHGLHFHGRRGEYCPPSTVYRLLSRRGGPPRSGERRSRRMTTGWTKVSPPSASLRLPPLPSFPSLPSHAPLVLQGIGSWQRAGGGDGCPSARTCLGGPVATRPRSLQSRCCLGWPFDG